MKKFKSLCCFFIVLCLSLFNNTSIILNVTHAEASNLIISSKKEFLDFANSVNQENEPLNFYGKTIDLQADIDLENEPFAPIGNGTSYFSGTFKGNGHTISNLSLQGDSFVGLFGVTDHAVIQDLNLDHVSVSALGDVGSLVGQSVYSTITNCKVTNLEMSTRTDSNIEDITVYMGGLVGYNNADISVNYFEEFTYNNPVALIENCSVEGTISITAPLEYGSIGGLVGMNHSGSDASRNINCTAKINNCSTRVDITGLSSDDMKNMPQILFIGGFAGSCFDSNSVSDKGSIIDSCFSQGIVNPLNVSLYSYVGGFIGYDFGYQGNTVIRNCGSTSKVFGGDSLKYESCLSHTGGFIGSISGTDKISDAITDAMKQSTDKSTNLISIENCYYIGDVTNGLGFYSFTGGFVGNSLANTINIQFNNCYCAAKLISRDSPQSKELTRGGFCGTCGRAEDASDGSSLFCKLENCYYDITLNSADGIASTWGETAVSSINGLKTSDCTSSKGLLKSLNNNIKNLNKSSEWSSWGLDANHTNYPTTQSSSQGNSMFLFIILGCIVLALILAIILFIVLRKKKKSPPTKNSPINSNILNDKSLDSVSGGARYNPHGSDPMGNMFNDAKKMQTSFDNKTNAPGIDDFDSTNKKSRYNPHGSDPMGNLFNNKKK